MLSVEIEDGRLGTYEVIRPEPLEAESRMAEAAFDLVVLYRIYQHFLPGCEVVWGGKTYQASQTAVAETIPAHQDVAVKDSPVPPPHMNL
jgi:hypothetical protein